MIIWTLGWSLTFILGTVYNLSFNQLSSEEWKSWWVIMLSVQALVSLGTAIWFTFGGAKDIGFLFKSLASIKTDENDDGTVKN